MQQLLLEVRNVSISFGDHRVLEDVSFRIPQGSIFGIVGSSGAGKTTLMRILTGFYKPTRGEVFYAGVRGDKALDKLRREVGFVTQNNCFYDELSVWENIKYFGTLYDVEQGELVRVAEYLLRSLRLWDARLTTAADLSGGMQRRLDVACGLIHNPPVIIMDEPTAGLDPVLRGEFWKLIRELGGERTVIFSSQILEEVERLCDNLVVIDSGGVLASGTLEEVRSRYTKNYEISLRTHPGDYQLLSESFSDASHISYWYHTVDQLFLVSLSPHEAIKEVSSVLEGVGEELLDIDIQHPHLDEVFAFLTKHDA